MPKLSSKEQEKKQTLRTFSLATFLNDTGAEMINPIWPLFLTTVLGANMQILGLIDGLGEALVSISQAISGYYSDRLKKRKVFIWTGYICGAASRLGYAITTSWPMIIPFRILDRAGKIRGAPRDAMVADLSTHNDRGRNFGVLRTMDNAGAVVGIIACIFFVNMLHIDYQTMFLIAAVPSVIGAAAIYLVIKERKMQKIKLFKGMELKNLDKNFKLFLLLSALFALGAFSYSFLLLFAKQLGWAVTTVPILYLIYNFIAAICSLAFGKLSDRIGRKKVLYISFAIWIITCITFITTNAVWAIIACFIMYGLHKGAFDTVQKAFVSELAPKKFKASALGAFQMVIGICALPASLIAGTLWDTINPTAPFIFSLGVSIVAIILLIFVKETSTD